MNFILEVFLAVLLCTAIGYGIILNRRIKELRKDQDNLDKLAKNFAKATSRAEASIQQLKVTSDATSQALDRAIKQASGIREDLMYLMERGEKLADVLEIGIRSKEGRSPTESLTDKGKKTPAKVKRASAPKQNFEGLAKGEAERELIRALRAVR